MLSGAPPPITCMAAECSEFDGQQRCFVASNFAHEDAPSRNQTFFIGKCRAGPLAHGGKCRLETGGANDRRHHPICRTACGFDQRIGAGRGFDASAGESGTKVAVATLVGDDRKLGPMLHGKLGEAPGIAASGQGNDRVRCRIAADEIERVLADRASGAEYRDAPRTRHRRSQPDGFGMHGEHGHTQRLTR